MFIWCVNIENLKPFISQYDIELYDIELTAKTSNQLYRVGKTSLMAILNIKSYEELMKIRNFGRNSYTELINKMCELGFTEWVNSIESQSKFKPLAEAI